MQKKTPNNIRIMAREIKIETYGDGQYLRIANLTFGPVDVDNEIEITIFTGDGSEEHQYLDQNAIKALIEHLNKQLKPSTTKDRNAASIEKGSIIDLHQTVNGENIFVVMCVNPLDVRYGFDLTRKYEYDVNELFKPQPYSDLGGYEIVGNIFKLTAENIDRIRNRKR
jgi:hypothetical protein